MTENRSRPRPVDFAWSDPEPVQKEPDGPALGNYPGNEYNPDDFFWQKVERRATIGSKIADFLDKLADRARGWH